MEVIKNEFISKIEVVKILQKAYAEGRIKSKDGLASVLDDINVADVKPVKRGHWEEIEDYDGDVHYRCTNCKTEFYLEAGSPEENEYFYCPRCGADMRGDT